MLVSGLIPRISHGFEEDGVSAFRNYNKVHETAGKRSSRQKPKDFQLFGLVFKNI